MSEQSAYRVLARKYRPTTFADLVGQEALVRTLTNAIAAGRIPHAFLLTGIRGIGKTTTARIIARALNCIGADGQGGPTHDPCGQCPNCKSIAADRHPDVLEMDAASRTGVGDIRELIETVQYLPTAGRYKVYIIDEVHMLSNNAFNALLKTLEEPPAHVKFIFATTELRKIPVTILSRCMRFDLRRLDAERMAGHLKNVCAKENVEAEEGALALIAAASEGSVRDGLSLLDQAIARGDGKVLAADVQDMLGLADRASGLELFEALMGGDIQAALAKLRALYDAGLDPVLALQDLLDITYLVTRVKLTPELANDASLPEAHRAKAAQLAGKLLLPVLARAWQMLLKGLQEARTAPSPLAAVEMALVRLAYAADLPTPGEAIRKLENGEAASPTPPRPSAAASAPAYAPVSAGGAAPQRAPQPQASEAPVAALASFQEAAALFAQNNELLLYHHMVHDVRPVRFEHGKLEIAANDALPADFPGKIGKLLSDWTGTRWMVAVAAAQGGAPTLGEMEAARKQQRMTEAAQHPLVAKVIELFPGAEILSVTNLQS